MNDGRSRNSRGYFVFELAIRGPRILAKREENRVTQGVLVCPSAELDARDQAGRNPGWFFVGFGHSVERASGRSQFFQPAAQFRQFFLVKSAPDVSNELKLLALIQAQQQRAEGKCWGASRSPATDHGVYCLGTLQLYPVRASIRNVRAVGSFREDSFQAILFRQRE